MANEDQIRGDAKDTGGKLKEEAGKLTGNEKMKQEGLEQQVEGKAQRTKGDVKDSI